MASPPSEPAPDRLGHAWALIQRLGRSPWVVVGLLALVGLGAFAVGKATASPASLDQQLPPQVAIPAHASLVRREDYIAEDEQNWYYAVPGTSHQALIAFYQAHLAQDGWTCIKDATSTDITFNGKAYSGSSVYITALRGGRRAQIYTADQEYGSFLLQDDLDAGSIALKISLEPAKSTACV